MSLSKTFAGLGVVLSVAFVCGCSEDKTPDSFTAEEAEQCLTAIDREARDRACDKVRAYDAAKKANAMTEEIERGYDSAIEELRSLSGKVMEGCDDAMARRRSASINWTLVAATYNRFNGTCACQVQFAAMKGLVEARRMVQNPPRGLTTYLLSPGDPRRLEEEYKDPNGFQSVRELGKE